MPRRGQPTGDPALKTPARRALRAAVLAQVKAGHRGCEIPDCVMNSRVIDWRAPRFDPWAMVLDEILPRDRGGRADDPANVRPAHWRCNSRAGTAITNAKLAARRHPPQTITLAIDDW